MTLESNKAGRGLVGNIRAKRGCQGWKGKDVSCVVRKRKAARERRSCNTIMKSYMNIKCASTVDCGVRKTWMCFVAFSSRYDIEYNIDLDKKNKKKKDKKDKKKDKKAKKKDKKDKKSKKKDKKKDKKAKKKS